MDTATDSMIFREVAPSNHCVTIACTTGVKVTNVHNNRAKDGGNMEVDTPNKAIHNKGTIDTSNTGDNEDSSATVMSIFFTAGIDAETISGRRRRAICIQPRDHRFR